MKINEIFRSIQGEGTLQGEPTIFIRTTGCNLRCEWCDTTYAYDEGKDLKITEILEEVLSLSGDNVKWICLTGGEPLIQKDLDNLIGELKREGFKIAVETNGTKNIGDCIADKFIVDYKLKGSKPKQPFCRENFDYMNGEDELKFVIGSREDYEEAKKVIEVNKIHSKILVSPMWEANIIQDLAEWIKEDDLNVRYSLQIHKVIWDKNKRGV